MAALNDAALYVGRRLLLDICDVLTPIDDRFEDVYQHLIQWMEQFTTSFGERIIPQLPEVNFCPDLLDADIANLYCGIIQTNVVNNIKIKALFTVTYYMMVQYRLHVASCSQIALAFTVVSDNYANWEFLLNSI